MINESTSSKTPRRAFIGSIATGAATLGMASFVNPFQLNAATGIAGSPADADAWFGNIKGKHRIVFDVTQPHEIFPFAWPKVYLVTNSATGTPENMCSVVVVLRHSAIGYAMKNELWTKYKFGEMFKVDDPQTKSAATSNPFLQRPADKIPGVGEVQIGIEDLQKSGVMFCVCDMALTVFSAAAAMGMGGDAAEIKKEWTAGVLPNIQVVPSGVWAVGRAQEHGCAYCFAG